MSTRHPGTLARPQAGPGFAMERYSGECQFPECGKTWENSPNPQRQFCDEHGKLTKAQRERMAALLDKMRQRRPRV